MPDDDGTPISDLKDMIRDLEKEVVDLKQRLQVINYYCNASYWTATRRWEIEKISSRGYKP